MTVSATPPDPENKEEEIEIPMSYSRLHLVGAIAAIVAVLALLVASFLSVGCGPSTPGTGMLCGPAPDPTVCPNATCQCFLVACGWSCGSNDQPGEGWTVNSEDMWVAPDAGTGAGGSGM